MMKHSPHLAQNKVGVPTSGDIASLQVHMPDGMGLEVVTGNYFDKYRSGNPIYQRLVNTFIRSAKRMLDRASPTRVVEIGCGPGDLAYRLFDQSKDQISYSGIDLGEHEIQTARARYPAFAFQVASAYSLPFPAQSADLVIACEVLEHLDDPRQGLLEADRICSGHILVSVPWEPVWRALNLFRGKYVRQWGNTPGHVQHFTRRAIKRLISERFQIVAVETPFPWTMILGKKHG